MSTYYISLPRFLIIRLRALAIAVCLDPSQSLAGSTTPAQTSQNPTTSTCSGRLPRPLKIRLWALTMAAAAQTAQNLPLDAVTRRPRMQIPLPPCLSPNPVLGTFCSEVFLIKMIKVLMLRKGNKCKKYFLGRIKYPIGVISLNLMFISSNVEWYRGKHLSILNEKTYNKKIRCQIKWFCFVF